VKIGPVHSDISKGTVKKKMKKGGLIIGMRLTTGNRKLIPEKMSYVSGGSICDL